MTQASISNDTFNRRINIIIAIMVAITALLSTFITRLESEASTEASKASIAEQEYYYQSIGTQLSGETDVNHAFRTVYQLWYQYEVQRLSAQKRGETEAAQTYAELRDSVAKTSTLFDPRYFNANTGRVNIRLYEADIYRRQLYELEEKQAAASDVSSAWEDKSGQYSLQLTLLAVAGFLFGLALMTKGRIPTLVFTVSGIGLMALVSLWAYQVFDEPIISRPANAITAFAEGASLVDQREWEQALELLTQAIADSGVDNPYGRAYLLRAGVYSALDNSNEAIKDYQAALNSGFTGDPTVQASLARVYFSIGDFRSALQTGTKALEDSPDNLALRQQVVMATLASGYLREASKQLNDLLKLAAEQVDKQKQIGNQNAATDVIWLLNDAAHQYDQLSALLETKADSAFRKNINDPTSVRKKAAELASQIRANTIAIQYGIDSNQAASLNPEARIDINSITPSKTPDQKYIYKVDMELAYSNVGDGQLLSITTYHDGIEDPSWNFSEPWATQQKNGSATITLSPSYSSLYIVPPGLYTVSIYLDGKLQAKGEFNITGDDQPQADTTNDNFALNSLLDQFDPYTGTYSYSFSDQPEDGSYDSYSYDPYFFFADENYYLYFLQDSYNLYTDYCSDGKNISCYTAEDADQDGIPDELDNCTSEPGSFENNGCPVAQDDADGDGILNDFDACPYEFGLEETNGCAAQTAASDSDSDGTPDNLDNCLYEPGSTNNAGCPISANDADGDGTADELDLCPYVPGYVNKGCPAEGAEPDSDSDGVPDRIDLCADQPGPADYSGCPLSSDDADGDGIIDTNDACPFVIGDLNNNGCPNPDSGTDTDGDGILDSKDLCQSEIGPLENGGCPTTSASDFDKDGILDPNDSCPYEPGLIEDNGCPNKPTEPDSDGDGIPDAQDACINEPGLIEDNGCPNKPTEPDSDGDGIPDAQDACINEPGLIEDNGCPSTGYHPDRQQMWIQRMASLSGNSL